jgi:hypothetical protein
VDNKIYEENMDKNFRMAQAAVQSIGLESLVACETVEQNEKDQYVIVQMMRGKARRNIFVLLQTSGRTKSAAIFGNIGNVEGSMPMIPRGFPLRVKPAARQYRWMHVSDIALKR